MTTSSELAGTRAWQASEEGWQHAEPQHATVSEDIAMTVMFLAFLLFLYALIHTTNKS